MCGRGFSRKSHLITYQRTNTGGKACVCGKYGWGFIDLLVAPFKSLLISACTWKNSLKPVKSYQEGKTEQPTNLHRKRKSSPGQHGGALQWGLLGRGVLRRALGCGAKLILDCKQFWFHLTKPEIKPWKE